MRNISSLPSCSIIIPVYNAEHTIVRCVESILNQTYQNFKVVLVVDGATDNSSKLCHSFAEKDSRICVIDKENGGVSSARNVGLSVVDTEWLTFIDSDDYFSADALEIFMDNIHDSDLVISGFCRTKKGETIFKYVPETIVLKKDSFGLLFTKFTTRLKNSVWGKLFKTSVIKANELRFEESMHHSEDLVFLYSYITLIDSISFTDKCLYFYDVSNPHSLSIRYNSYKNEFYNYLMVRDAISKIYLLLNNNPDCIDRLSSSLRLSSNRVLNSIYHSEKNARREERIKMIKSIDLDYLTLHTPHKTGSKRQDLLNYILLKKRWFYLYDLIRKIKISMKAF